jgi:outer membrane protein TolC
MKQSIKELISVFVVIAVASNCLAQAQEMTLSQCLEKGLENNYSLHVVRNEQQIAENNATRANAGQLPTVSASVGYNGSFNNRSTTDRSGNTVDDRNFLDHSLSAGINAEWMVFDGFKLQADYDRLRELKLQSETQTRVAIEDYIAELTSEYYNFVRQRIRMQNLNYAVRLSKERLRIVQERYIIGNNSRLDLQQAQVDFNADSAQSLKQRETLASSRIRLRRLMAERDMGGVLSVSDTAIYVNKGLQFDSLWGATQSHNSAIINAAHNHTLATIDQESVRSRDYPYVKLNAGYGYSLNQMAIGSTKRRQEWGADFGLTVGMKLFDGKRKAQMRNARLAVENAELNKQDLELSLYSDLCDLWQAYQNNQQLLALERQNLISARENYYIAHERYLLGDLSGIEMREAQKSLLDAEERILEAQYNTKLCEISLLLISGDITSYLK